MRKFITLALVAGCTALMADGNSSTANAQVGVKIVSPISIVNPNQSMIDFGKVTVEDATQAMAIQFEPNINGNGTAVYTNCAPYTGTSGPSSFAWFHIRKDHDIGWGNVSIVVPATLTLATDVVLTTKQSALDQCGTLGGFPVVLGNTTSADLRHFYVGGTLNAAANTYGTFSGTLSVIASYN